jgi:hypothetical protein
MEQATVPTRRPPEPLPVAVRVVVALLVAVAAFAGAVLIAGQLISGSETTKVVVAVLWFFAASFVLQRLLRGRPELRWPLRIGVLVAGLGLLGWYLFSLRDEDVQEKLVTAPATRAPATPAAPGAPRPAAPAGPQLIAAGSFRGLEHEGSGRAEVIRQADGRLLLQLRSFRTDSGPDLRLYLSTNDDAKNFVDLGALKGNTGNQRYTIPRGTNTQRYSRVLIWCRAFSVAFTSAPLRAA